MLTREKLEHRLITGAHVVVKTHEWTPHISEERFEELRPLFTHVIVSTRQGRDDDPAWMPAATILVAFEDVVAHGDADGAVGALLVLRRLAEHLGTAGLSDADLRAVDAELMALPVPQGYCNQTTKFWPHHARRGGRRAAPAA